MERVKALGDDNRSKAAEVERLRREVEGLRGLLLPHYRVCGDERVVAYLDGLGSVGGAWGGGAAIGRGSLGSLGGGLGELGLGEDDGSDAGRRGSMGSVGSGSEGFNGEEMGEDAEEEEEREEQRRRESEDMEEMFSGAGSGSSFDSGVTPVVEGMADDGMGGGLGEMDGMDGMMSGVGMDEVLGMGMEMEMGM